MVCSGFPTQIVITVMLISLGVPVHAADGTLSLRHIVWLSALDSLLIIALIVTFLGLRGEHPMDVLFGNRSGVREIVLGLLLIPVTFLLVASASAILEHLAPGLKSPEGNPLAALLRSARNIFIFALVAVIAGGVREELQRAFVLHRFEQHLGGAVTGLVIFSVAFGLGHALQGWDAAILTGLLGAFWGIVYLHRRSVIAPVVCHAAFNLVEIAFHGLQA
jgi:membrane protease YdiL (CAAX protease family)